MKSAMREREGEADEEKKKRRKHERLVAQILCI